MGRFKGKRKNNYPHERKNVDEGFIPPAFIEYYRQQFVPETLTESEFQIMVDTFRLPLNHTFRIVGSSMSSNAESAPSSYDLLRAKLRQDLSTFSQQIQTRNQLPNNIGSSNVPKSSDVNQSDNSNDNSSTSKNHLPSSSSPKIAIEKIESLNDMFGEIYRLSADKPSLRRDPALAPLRSWLNTNMKIGNLVRQELVSMVPPFFLDLKPNSRVLDVAAAPGSKTSQILAFVNQGLVVANDVNVSRSTMLVHNLGRLRNLHNEQVIVISHPAQYLPLFNHMNSTSVTAYKSQSKNEKECNNNGNNNNKNESNNENVNVNNNKNEIVDGDSNIIEKFDRVLCDVPCSGDGTLRKNPDASLKFSLENGASLHPIQRAILIRALKHLKEGGTLVYSTCSLNPIEDEAVVNSVVLESKGTVEIKDVSNMFPGMKRSYGIRNWKVLSEFRTPTMYSAYKPDQQLQDDLEENNNNHAENKNSNTDDSKSDKKGKVRREKIDNDIDIDIDDDVDFKNDNDKIGNGDEDEIDDFNVDASGDVVSFSSKSRKSKNVPNSAKLNQECDRLSQSPSNVIEGINRCMRFFPHQNDTGGFFVAVLNKLSNSFDELIEEPRLSHKPPFKWREHPYYRLNDISPAKSSILRDSFGLSDEFVSNLFVRDEEENLIRNIFYCSQKASQIVNSIDPGELRAVSSGVRVFTWKEFKDENTIKAVPCIEGVSVLKRNISDQNERLVHINADEMKLLLRAGNDGVSIENLKIADDLKKLRVGGLLFILDVLGTNICYGGLRLKDKVLLYVKKEIIEQEIERIDIEIDSLKFLKK